ncbi:PQQ-dependent sugar dehydrogenase [Pseudomonas sp.]|jgi:aldose sugar dehydrogenase|uniref:PQQ-dependent sugar dehydrogenase n=1 Tax=Pseudomonas sp. TaxID=306 RepID=UPI00272C0A10|nr:PQQ-dependent sugar dehydrogenase [Pseudomonas sp.]
MVYKSALLAAALGMSVNLAVQAVEYSVEVVVGDLEHPWSLAFMPDGRMLVTERAGRLRVIEADGTLRPDPVGGLPDIFVQSQGGLLEVALDPEYDQNERLFISYSCGSQTSNNTCLISARLQDNELVDVTEIFRAQPGKEGGAHYGGRIAFLADNTLVMGLGDAFILREESQSLANHIGSIIRINRDGSVPEDNPFVGREDAKPEIYTYGNRNVQGMVFDQQTNRLWSHEHGPRGGDELNLIEPGKNYGWPVITYGVDYSGAVISPRTRQDGMEQPIVDWTPSIAPAGMTLYRGDMFPEWQGNLLISALAGREVRRVVLDGTEVVDQQRLFVELDERFRDVRTGPDGAVYLLTDKEEGQVLRVTRD